MTAVLLTGSKGFIGKSLRKHQDIPFQSFLDVDQNGFVLEAFDSAPIQRFPFSELAQNIPSSISHIFHFGAVTSTTLSDKGLFNLLNIQTTNALVSLSCSKGLNLVVASSAAVYGNRIPMKESLDISRPKNLYAESKWESENFALNACKCSKSHISILRLFNIYGTEESHKGPMASIPWRFTEEAISNHSVTLYSRAGYELGSQSRDMVYVEDLIVFLKNYLTSNSTFGILNFGTGTSTSFMDIAKQLSRLMRNVSIKSILMDEEYFQTYQWLTLSDSSKFDTLFPNFSFTPLSEGLERILSLKLGSNSR